MLTRPGFPFLRPSWLTPRPSLSGSTVLTRLGLPRRGPVPGSPIAPRSGLSRGPPSRGLPRAFWPRAPPGPGSRTPSRARPSPPACQGLCMGKGFMYLVNPHRKEEQGHTPGILCCSIPSIFSMCMHGPVRKGVLADIVQVDPHVHACAPVTIIRWLARLPTLEELDLSWRFEEGELFQPSGNSFQRADMIPRGRDSRVPPFRAHPWPPVPRVPGGAPSRVRPCSRVPRAPPSPPVPGYPVALPHPP